VVHACKFVCLIALLCCLHACKFVCLIALFVPHANTNDQQDTDEDLAWALCNMQTKSLSNPTTNATNHQPVDKSSRITPEHIFGLLALNPGSPSSCSSFSTPSVADSVEFNETNPKNIDAIDKETPVIDQRAPNDTVMNDTESESKIQAISEDATLSVPNQKVCHLLLLYVSHSRLFGNVVF